MPEPYYQDDLVTLYLGNALEVTEWTAADVLVTDPPYGRGWKQGALKTKGRRVAGGVTLDDSHPGIIGDEDTSTRDTALEMWGTDRPVAAFGDLMLPPPRGTKQVLVFKKQTNAGARGAMAGFRRDAEAIYLVGKWPSGLGGVSSVIGTGSRSAGNPHSPVGRYGHPHAKPVDTMELLISHCPPGVIGDPFSGSGSTLVAARNLGRRAIGVEIEERYCERIAERLAARVFDFGDITATHSGDPS